MSKLKTTCPFCIPGFECVKSIVVPGEEQRGRPLPGSSVWHRPGRGAADSQMPGETLQGGQVRAGQVQLQLPGKVMRSDN